MEERRSANSATWFIGNRREDMINSDDLTKISLILLGVLFIAAIIALGLWQVTS